MISNPRYPLESWKVAPRADAKRSWRNRQTPMTSDDTDYGSTLEPRLGFQLESTWEVATLLWACVARRYRPERPSIAAEESKIHQPAGLFGATIHKILSQLSKIILCTRSPYLPHHPLPLIRICQLSLLRLQFKRNLSQLWDIILGTISPRLLRYLLQWIRDLSQLSKIILHTRSPHLSRKLAWSLKPQKETYQ